MGAAKAKKEQFGAPSLLQEIGEPLDVVANILHVLRFTKLDSEQREHLLKVAAGKLRDIVEIAKRYDSAPRMS